MGQAKAEAYSSIQLDLVFPRSWQSPSHLSHRPLPSHRFYEQEAGTEWSWESHTRWQGSARLLCPMFVPVLSDLDIGSLVEAFSGSGWSLPLVVLRGLHLLPGVTGFGNSIKNWLLVCALGRIWMKALKWLDLRGGRGGVRRTARGTVPKWNRRVSLQTCMVHSRSLSLTANEAKRPVMVSSLRYQLQLCLDLIVASLFFLSAAESYIHIGSLESLTLTA